MHYKLNPQSKDGEFFREYVVDDLDHLKESARTPSQRPPGRCKGVFP